MERELARNEFTVNASLSRVWDHLARAALTGVRGLEEIEFIDEENFAAKMEISFRVFSFRIPLKGTIKDASPPEYLAIKLEGQFGPARMSQEMAFWLRAEAEMATNVTAKATMLKCPEPLSCLLLWKVRRLAYKGLQDIEDTLARLA